MNKRVKVSSVRGVVNIRMMSHSDASNAYDDLLVSELSAALDLCNADRAIKVVILSGEGGNFSKGADTNWLHKILDYDYAANRVDSNAFACLFAQLANLRKPSIAKIEGLAVGSGVGLIASCDLAIASYDARFCLPEVRLGLTAALYAPYVIRAIGCRAARRYLLSGEHFDVTEALRLGLVHECVGADELDSYTNELAQQLILGGPRAIEHTKEMLQELEGLEISPALMDKTIEWTSRRRASVEGRQGIEAFLNNRKTPWLTSSHNDKDS